MPITQNGILWITAANVLYLASYSVRDILWLRILTVLAALLLVPYYSLQPSPLIAAIDWNIVFIAINSYWIVKLIMERRPIHFTPDEDRLRKLSFPSLTAREAQNLFAMGAWEDVAAGASIIEHDKRNGQFSVILRGACDVVYRGIMVSELGEGQFVGVIDLYVDRKADFDVLVRQNARIMCWARERLQAFIQKRPDVGLALERSVGLEVQRLLHSTLSELRD